jgi:hypothetical protein
VSLADIKAGTRDALARCGECGCPGCKTTKAIPALVELAEAYLAVRDLEDERERGRAEARLVLAAKGVRP